MLVFTRTRNTPPPLFLNEIPITSKLIMRTRVVPDKNGRNLFIEEHLPGLISFRYSSKPLTTSGKSRILQYISKYLKAILALCTLVVALLKLVSVLSHWKLFALFAGAKEKLLAHFPIFVELDETNSGVLWVFCIVSVAILLIRRYPGKCYAANKAEVGKENKGTILTQGQRND